MRSLDHNCWSWQSNCSGFPDVGSRTFKCYRRNEECRRLSLDKTSYHNSHRAFILKVTRLRHESNLLLLLPLLFCCYPSAPATTTASATRLLPSLPSSAFFEHCRLSDVVKEIPCIRARRHPLSLSHSLTLNHNLSPALLENYKLNIYSVLETELPKNRSYGLHTASARCA